MVACPTATVRSYLTCLNKVQILMFLPVFVVPQTHDMVSTLLSPSQPKNFSDGVILGILALHIVLFFALPSALQTPVLLIIFLFWRASYNAGIGYLLHVQSHHGQLVHWAKKYAIFDPSRQPQLYKLLKHEIETKIGHEVKNGDYVFDKAPIEFNTWLVFRRLVDLILMCDFTSYMLFAASCFHSPPGEGLGWTIARWVGGVLLFVFNIWVKLDAHRVVKDYAWCKYRILKRGVDLQQCHHVVCNWAKHSPFFNRLGRFLLPC
jgi:phosphatidylethanolamine N-methyltransferase